MSIAWLILATNVDGGEGSYSSNGIPLGVEEVIVDTIEVFGDVDALSRVDWGVIVIVPIEGLIRGLGKPVSNVLVERDFVEVFIGLESR